MIGQTYTTKPARSIRNVSLGLSETKMSVAGAATTTSSHPRLGTLRQSARVLVPMYDSDVIAAHRENRGKSARRQLEGFQSLCKWFCGHLVPDYETPAPIDALIRIVPNAAATQQVPAGATARGVNLRTKRMLSLAANPALRLCPDLCPPPTPMGCDGVRRSLC